MCGDVQKYDKQIYLRVSEAQRCRVHSTVVIPFFEPAERHRALGVIEVVKNDKGVSFTQLLEDVIASLEVTLLFLIQNSRDCFRVLAYAHLKSTSIILKKV